MRLRTEINRIHDPVIKKCLLNSLKLIVSEAYNNQNQDDKDIQRKGHLERKSSAQIANEMPSLQMSSFQVYQELIDSDNSLISTIKAKFKHLNRESNRVTNYIDI